MWKQGRFGPSGQLFGIIHALSSCSPSSPLVIFLPGFGQPSTEKNYLFTRLRHLLASKGCRCMQFDYYGHGDSDGDLSEVSLSSLVSDTNHIISDMVVQNSPSTIFLVGNGLGAIVGIKAIQSLNGQFSSEQVQHIIINPPLQPLRKVFSNEDLQKLYNIKGNGIPCTDLVGGENYYTLEDFPIERLQYILQLGSHITNLHGQSVSMRLLQELESLDTIQLIQSIPQHVHILLGDLHPCLDKLKCVPNACLYTLSKVQYYFQSPQAQDELINTVDKIVYQTLQYREVNEW